MSDDARGLDGLAGLFRSSLTFDERLTEKAAGGKGLSAEEARELLRKKVGGGTLNNVVTAAIVRALTDEQMTDSFISAMDLRPFFAVARDRGKPFFDQVASQYRSAADLPGQLDDDEGYQDAADSTIAKLSSEAMERATGAAQQVGLTGRKLLDVQEAAAVFSDGVVKVNADARLAEYTTAGELGVVTPDNAQQAAEYVAGGEDFDVQALIDDEVNTPEFDEAQLRELFRTGLTDFTGIISAEQEFNGEHGTNEFVDVLEGTHDGFAGVVPEAAPPRRLNTRQALDYLHGKTPAEIAKLQEKLAAGGYYERVGKTNPETGYALDEPTQAAWRELVADSIRTGQPFDQVMRGAVQRYQGQLFERQQKARGGINEFAFRDEINGMLGERLGREVSGAEAKKLMHYLAELRAEAAGLVPGRDDDRIAEVGEAGYDEEAFAERIDETFGEEERSGSFFDVMQTLQSKYTLIPMNQRGGRVPGARDPREDYVDG